MAIQWGLAGNGGFQNAFAMGQHLGNQIRQTRADNALAAYAKNPGEETLGGVIEADPRLGYRLREHEAERAAAARKEQLGAIPTTINMLRAAKANPQAYGAIRAQAIQMGIPGAESVPEQFDPAWVDQQLTTMEAFATPQGQEALSTAGKQAMDLGYRPGTPEFASVTRQIIEAGMARPYTGAQGETRLYTPQIGGQGQALGGIPRISGTADYDALPPGAEYIDPNGNRRTKSGGGVSNGTGNFRSGQ